MHICSMAKGWVRGDRLKKLGPVHTLMENKFYVDELYDWVIVKPLSMLSNFLAWVFDLRILDGFINGIGKLVEFVGGTLRGVQAGFIRSYAAWLLLGTLGLVIYLVIR